MDSKESRSRSGSLTLDDWYKRKRESLTPEDTLKKSKVTSAQEDDKEIRRTLLENIMEKLEKLSSEIKEVKEAVNMDDVKEELRQMREENKKCREEWIQEKCKWETERNLMKKTITEMEDKVTYLENQSRRDNIVIRGVQEMERESWDDTVKVVIDVGKRIGIDISKEDVTRAHRIGYGKTPRPIVVKMRSWRMKNEFMKNKKKLKGSDVIIQEDLAKKTIEERKKLLEEARKRRDHGENAYVSYDKLVTDRDIFKWDSINQCLCSVKNRTEKKKYSSGKK